MDEEGLTDEQVKYFVLNSEVTPHSGKLDVKKSTDFAFY